MTTTRDDINEWLTRAHQKGAAYMIVVCDTFDWEDYPVFVKPGEDVHAEVRRLHGPNMQKVMEVYDLSGDIPEQLDENRAGQAIIAAAIEAASGAQP